jgi:putative membrane protein
VERKQHRPPSLVARGFLMGSADLVPGVSGGTVALVTGIYEELIDTVRLGASAVGHLVRLDVRGMQQRLREIRWSFVLPLGAGILLAVVTLARVIGHLLEEEPVRMAALFFGLVAGSVVLALPRVRHWGADRAISMVVVGMLAFLLLGLRGAPVSDPAIWMFFLAGAIAICAMILPGISGSFILLMIGMYDAVLDTVNDREVGFLLVFVIGCAIGLMAFSNVLHWALERAHDMVMAGLIGLMIGSLRVLWPWPTGLEGAEDGSAPPMTWPQDDVVVPIVIAVVAFAVLVGIGFFLFREVEHQSEPDRSGA